MSNIGDLPDWVGQYRNEIVSDLANYVSRETPSDDKILLAAGLEWLEDWLQRRLGAPARLERVDGGAYGDTLILDYTSKNGNSTWTTALCHYDTVWSSGTLANWSPAINGDHFTGPGAFDMKGGLVQLVWALKAGEALGLPRPNLRLVLNGDEEIGSPISRPVIEAQVIRGSTVLVFEASADGAIKTERKGVGIFQVEATGVEVHAGLNPEAGASAIDEIARAVCQLHGSADTEEGTTLNAGTIRGGTRTNVKAGYATAGVDVRVSSEAEARRIDAVFEGLQTHNSEATLTVSGGWNRPVMARSQLTSQLFAVAASAAEEMGFSLEEVSVGGGSDGNFAAALGLPVLDGLGAVGDGAHARNEWISIDGMLQRTALAAGLLTKLTEADNFLDISSEGAASVSN
jgi:glutamate carboxypeptidase